jgi:AhpD family alkylhydroperoxidase
MEHPPPFDFHAAFPAGYRPLQQIERELTAAPLDQPLRELVKMRASQINGCAYCLDMHYKDARAAGETEERLYMLPAWREARVYSDAERAALALTEAITLISEEQVPEDVEREARAHFDDQRYAELVMTIVLINAWNRLAITGHSVPGLYQPRTHTAS